MLATITYYFLFISLPGYCLFSQIPNQKPQPVLSISGDTLQTPGDRFKKATRLSQYLFSGPRYHIYDRTAETHQFFKSRDLLRGTLRYDGRDYGPLNMHFDINLKQLVVEQPQNGYLVRLDTAKVTHFTIDGDYFVNISDNPGLQKGIYQVISDQKTKLYCLRGKQRLEKAENQTLNIVFLDKDAFYMSRGDQFVTIKSKRDLYRYFPEHKAKIRSYFRDGSHNSFRSNKEQYLREIVNVINSTEI